MNACKEAHEKRRKFGTFWHQPISVDFLVMSDCLETQIGKKPYLRKFQMSLALGYMDTNLVAALVGGAIALAGSAFGGIVTAHRDRYKRDLEDRAKRLYLMSALLDEIKHLKSSVSEALQEVKRLVETKILEEIPTKRLKTDFLQGARFQISYDIIRFRSFRYRYTSFSRRRTLQRHVRPIRK